jgi:hypothetical protein
MTITIDQLVAQDNGRLVNNGGVQCVAIANEVEQKVLGGGWIAANLASDWWNYFNNDAVERVLYAKIGANAPSQEGDLAVWGTYPGTNPAQPHIALVLADLGTAGLSCLTQNPGNARIANLTKNGLLGYLRPVQFITASTPAAPAPVAPAASAVNLTVKVTTSFLNVRPAPTTANTPLHQNTINTAISIIGIVKGQQVTSNGITSNVWLEAWNHTYVWSGNTNYTGAREI